MDPHPSHAIDSLFYEYLLVFECSITGGTVEVHHTHTNPCERDDNITFAIRLARQGICIQLLPWGKGVCIDMKIKNTDAVIEYKNFNSASFDNIYSRIRVAWRQIKRSGYPLELAAIAVNLSNLNATERAGLIQKVFRMKIRILYVEVNETVTKVLNPKYSQ